MISESLLQNTVSRKTLSVGLPVRAGRAPAKHTIGFGERMLVLFFMNLQAVFIVCKAVKSPALIWKTLGKLIRLKQNLWGGNHQRMQKINGRYHLHLYAPAWPSKAHDVMIKNEALHQAFPLTYNSNKTFIFLAVTRKCPLRCEHCFEWENLNHKESFSREELMQVVDLYQQEGILQIHLSGGEPMVRLNDLEAIIGHAKTKSDCFVLTSGFNCTTENALRLKAAGCTGVIVSIDHYLPEIHNAFRHHPGIFQQAVNAVNASLQAGMLTGISVCTTREFINEGHLLPYLEFAKKLGGHYVQLLEPRDVGHYAGKNVLLDEPQLKVLESFFIEINSKPAYKEYPTVLYHGYHQRRMGCYTGSHSVYIDSAGDVHACPFCHTKSYNIRDMLQARQLPANLSVCPSYGNAR